MNLDCFDNNDIRRMTTMKKYPYTESTDLIIYDQKPKKEKKQKNYQSIGITDKPKLIYLHCLLR